MEALKAFLTALKMEFTTMNGRDSETPNATDTIIKEADKAYNPEFVAMIKKGDEDYEAGRYKAIKTEELWK